MRRWLWTLALLPLGVGDGWAGETGSGVLRWERLALYMAYLESTSMWDQYSKIIGLFGGGLAGLFAVGILTRRTTAPGALLGFLGSAVLLFCVRSYTPVQFFLYPAIGLGGCFLIGYAASLVIPAGRRNLEGLTVFTPAKR